MRKMLVIQAMQIVSARKGSFSGGDSAARRAFVTVTVVDDTKEPATVDTRSPHRSPSRRTAT